MTSKNRPHKRTAANPEDVAAELRILIREAHEAMSGLSKLIREGEKLLHFGADDLVDHAVEDGVNTKMAELEEFLKEEAKRISALMVTEVQNQRDWIMNNLQLIAVTETPDGLKAHFNTKGER